MNQEPISSMGAFANGEFESEMEALGEGARR